MYAATDIFFPVKGGGGGGVFWTLAKGVARFSSTCCWYATLIQLANRSLWSRYFWFSIRSFSLWFFIRRVFCAPFRRINFRQRETNLPDNKCEKFVASRVCDPSHTLHLSSIYITYKYFIFINIYMWIFFICIIIFICTIYFIKYYIYYRYSRYFTIISSSSIFTIYYTKFICSEFWEEWVVRWGETRNLLWNSI